jgi:hypothetical protein
LSKKWLEGTLNGVVFFDGQDDDGRIELKKSVRYDAGKGPGTWNWLPYTEKPKKQLSNISHTSGMATVAS